MRLKRPKPFAVELTHAEILRLLRRTRVDANGCWLWQGHTDDKGYGQMSLRGRAHWAHRIAYRAFNGPIPAGIEVHHECLNPTCCNPRHLELMTKAENVAEANARRAA